MAKNPALIENLNELEEIAATEAAATKAWDTLVGDSQLVLDLINHPELHIYTLPEIRFNGINRTSIDRDRLKTDAKKAVYDAFGNIKLPASINIEVTCPLINALSAYHKSLTVSELIPLLLEATTSETKSAITAEAHLRNNPELVKKYFDALNRTEQTRVWLDLSLNDFIALIDDDRTNEVVVSMGDVEIPWALKAQEVAHPLRLLSAYSPYKSELIGSLLQKMLIEKDAGTNLYEASEAKFVELAVNRLRNNNAFRAYLMSQPKLLDVKVAGFIDPLSLATELESDSSDAPKTMTALKEISDHSQNPNLTMRDVIKLIDDGDLFSSQEIFHLHYIVKNEMLWREYTQFWQKIQSKLTNTNFRAVTIANARAKYSFEVSFRLHKNGKLTDLDLSQILQKINEKDYVREQSAHSASLRAVESTEAQKFRPEAGLMTLAKLNPIFAANENLLVTQYLEVLGTLALEPYNQGSTFLTKQIEALQAVVEGNPKLTLAMVKKQMADRAQEAATYGPNLEANLAILKARKIGTSESPLVVDTASDFEQTLALLVKEVPGIPVEILFKLIKDQRLHGRQFTGSAEELQALIEAAQSSVVKPLELKVALEMIAKLAPWLPTQTSLHILQSIANGGVLKNNLETIEAIKHEVHKHTVIFDRKPNNAAVSQEAFDKLLKDPQMKVAFDLTWETMKQYTMDHGIEENMAGEFLEEGRDNFQVLFTRFAPHIINRAFNKFRASENPTMEGDHTTNPAISTWMPSKEDVREIAALLLSNTLGAKDFEHWSIDHLRKELERKGLRERFNEYRTILRNFIVSDSPRLIGKQIEEKVADDLLKNNRLTILRSFFAETNRKKKKANDPIDLESAFTTLLRAERTQFLTEQRDKKAQAQYQRVSELKASLGHVVEREVEGETAQAGDNNSTPQ